MRHHYHVIAACSCWGAQIRACEKGPEDLVEGRVFERLQSQGISIREVEMLYPEKLARNENIPPAQSLGLIRDFNLQVVKAVRGAVQKGSFPIVVGGDHSVAVGTWNSFDVPFGLLWIDAHVDSHTDKTTPSGAYHGMPLAGLLGHGLPELSQLVKKTAVLKPKNLAIIGARSYEPGEIALLQELNVKVYFMDEVLRRGFKEVLAEATKHIMQGVNHYGVSVDLDVFHVDEAPGVGSPEEGGIRKKEVLPLLHAIGKDPRLLAFELVEFNPERDVNHKTRELAFEILKEVMRP